jgi:hypothetical protein
MARQRKVRWARLTEIDRRTKVGTRAWKSRHTTKQKKLSAWRYLHVKLSHRKVQRRAGVKPSSNMGLKRMLRVAEVE